MGKSGVALLSFALAERRPSWRRALASLGCIGLAACAIGPANAPMPPGVAVAVDMGFNTFYPRTVTIGAGQTVQWRNNSIATHTVTDDPARDPGAARLPAGVPPFDSGDIPRGEVYQHRFDVPGTYSYFCTHHDGMVGTVYVIP